MMSCSNKAYGPFWAAKTVDSVLQSSGSSSDAHALQWLDGFSSLAGRTQVRMQAVTVQQQAKPAPDELPPAMLLALFMMDSGNRRQGAMPVCNVPESASCDYASDFHIWEQTVCTELQMLKHASW